MGPSAIVQNTDNAVDADPICSANDLEHFTDPTLIRIRGNIHVQLGSQLPAAGAVETIRVNMGIIVLDVNQIGAPNPADPDGADRDWLWTWTTFVQTEQELQPVWNTNTNAVQDVTRTRSRSNSFERIVVDVKAMRKIQAFHEVRFVTFTNIIEGSPTMRADYNFRLLIKE